MACEVYLLRTCQAAHDLVCGHFRDQEFVRLRVRAYVEVHRNLDVEVPLLDLMAVDDEIDGVALFSDVGDFSAISTPGSTLMDSLRLKIVNSVMSRVVCATSVTARKRIARAVFMVLPKCVYQTLHAGPLTMDWLGRQA